MVWSCGAITNGVTFYQNNTIAPCCVIDHTYRKPASEIHNQPFADINTGVAPSVCQRCHRAESLGIQSSRQYYNSLISDLPGIQFVDIRNTNVCNAKCRTCGPYNSNQWANELGLTQPIVKSDIQTHHDLIVTPSLRHIYYTGGEPFINPEHWALLEQLIKLDYSKNISLRYNSNLGTLKFKDKDILDLWKNFRSVSVMASIDAVGNKFNFLRSGLDFDTVDANFKKLVAHKHVQTQITATVSILNIWFISELIDYYQSTCLVTLTDLHYPDFLSLTAMPDELQDLALKHLDSIEQRYHDKNKIKYYRDQILNNHNKHLFRDTVAHTLLLDSIRQEKLFDCLPFQTVAQKLVCNQ